MKRPLNRYRFLTYKCRRWLPCKSGKGPFHTHHLLLVIPPLRKAEHEHRWVDISDYDDWVGRREMCAICSEERTVRL